MPAPASATDLLDLVRKSGIVAPDRLSEHLADAPNLPPDAIQSAALLVQRGVLTRFQAQLLLNGRYRGFKLGPYVVREQIGRGGMGAVYLAEHESLRRRVAVKVLTPLKGDAAAHLALERFLREARAAAALDHPNIVRLIDIGQQAGVHYLVLEHVDGRTLEEMSANSGAIPPGRAVGYVAQAAAGLQHAYERGFVHRDIKPANLMLTKDGTVKILDMGLARSGTAEDKLTERLDVGAIVGTADYISPEQALDSSGIDIRSDVYSLGATLYALVSGKPPFGGNTSQKLTQHQMKDATPLDRVDRTVPPALAAVVAKMLAKRPEKRYQTPAQVIVALAPWLADDGAKKLLTGLSGTDLADSMEMQNTISELAAGSTARMRSRRLGPRRRAWGPWAAAAGAVTVAAGAVAFVLLGGMAGEKKDPPPVSGTPPAVAERPAATKPDEAARPPAGGVVLFRFDPGTLPDGRFAVRGDDVIEGARFPLPAGWKMHCWKPDGVGEFAVDRTGDRPALAVACREGDNGVQLAFQLTDDLKLDLPADREHEVRIEYATRRGAAAYSSVQNKGANYQAVGGANLPDTGGRWATARYAFRRPPGADLQLGFDPQRGAEPGVVLVRSIEVVDPAAAAGRLYALDFAALPPAALDLPAGGPVRFHSEVGAARLPDGMSINRWNQATAAECRVADVDGARAVGLRLTGGGGIQLHAPCGGRLDQLAAGGRAVVRLTYANDGRVAGSALVEHRQEPYEKFATTPLPATGGRWHTVRIPFTRPAADGRYELVVRAGTETAAADGTVWVKSIELLDPAAETAPPAAERVVYRLDLAGQKAFTDRGRTDGSADPWAWKSEAKAGDGSLPAGWRGMPWNLADAAEYFADHATGRTAIGVRTVSGSGSAMLFAPDLDLPGGKARARIEYRTEAGSAAALFVRFKPSRPAFGEVRDVRRLPPTGGEWKAETVDVDLSGYTGGYFELHNNFAGPNDAVRVAGFTVTDPTAARPPADAPAGPPAAAFDFGKTEPFRFTVADGAASAEHAGKLPAGVHAGSGTADAVTEFRAAAVAGRTGVGLTNLNAANTGHMLFADLGTLAGGTTYRVRVEYLTANDATGRLSVRRPDDDKAVAGGDLPATGGRWSAASFEFTAPVGTPLDVRATNAAVGEGNTLYVGKLEVFEVR